MIKRNLFKTAVITMSVLTLSLGMTACGKKNNTVKNNDTTVTQENITAADKNNEKKSSKVVFDYTDADGMTTKLEGNATVSDNGEAVIEVIDNNGNKAVFTGKATTVDGKLSVSDISVKDASTLVKTDGTEVKVSEDAKIEDATESTEATKADVAAKEEPKEDTIVADGGNTGTDNNVSEGNENAGDNGADNGNVSDTPSEPEYVPDVPSEPEPTPEEPQPSEPEEPEVITTVNPFDGKTYTYVAPEDMDYKLSFSFSLSSSSYFNWYAISRGMYSGGVLLDASQSSNVRTGIPVCCENSFLVIPTLSLSCFIVSAIVIIYPLLMHFYYCNIVLYVTQCVVLSYALFQSHTSLLILSIYSVQ